MKERPIILTTPLLSLLGTALALRLLAVAIFDPVMISDDRDYLHLAQSLANGSGFQLEGLQTAYRMPGYPLLLSWFFRSFGTELIPVRLFQAVVDTFTCWLVYRTGSDISTTRQGWLAGWIYALFPLQILYVTSIMTETIVACLLLLALRPVLVHTRQSRHLLISGIFLGLAALMRPTVILLPILALIPNAREPLSLTHRLRRLAMISVPMLLVISPWLIRNADVFGRFSLTSNTGVNFWMGNHEGASGSYDFPPNNALTQIPNEYDRSDAGMALGLRFWITEPIAAGLIVPKKLAHLFGIDYWQLQVIQYQSTWKSFERALDIYRDIPFATVLATHLPFMIVTIAGLLALSLSASPQHHHWLIIAVLICIWVGVHLIFYGGARYRFPLHPFIILAASEGIALIRRGLPEVSTSRKLILGFVILPIAGGWMTELWYLLLS